MTTIVNWQAAQSSWEWPLRLDCFRRHERLSKDVCVALQTLGLASFHRLTWVDWVSE